MHTILCRATVSHPLLQKSMIGRTSCFRADEYCSSSYGMGEKIKGKFAD